MEASAYVIPILVIVAFVSLYALTRKKPKNAAEAERKSRRNLLLDKHKELFDSLLPHPLTREQRESIVDDSHRTLVIAAAGSGKTTTLIGKYAFLVKEGLATPGEILILAFNRDISEEVKDRLKQLLSVDAEVFTFHAFGRKLLTEAEGAKKVDSLAESSEDGLLTTSNIRKVVEKAKKTHPKIENWIMEFRLLCPRHQIQEFARNEKEYREAVRGYPYKRDYSRTGGNFRPLRIPSLDGKHWVRSQQELTIVNSLVMKGVKVEYEKPYPGLDAAYSPDFHYPEINLWHEHFAVDRDGGSIFGREYVEQMNRKKDFLEKRNADCLFTYSYEYYDGSLLGKIFRELDRRGVSYHPPSAEEINRRLEELYIDDTYGLISTCVKLAKTNGLDAASVSQRLDSLDDRFRSGMFKRFFLPIFESYQKTLEENGTVDFEDMISKPTGYLGAEGGNGLLPERYKYVLVDEFQDLSECRKKFLARILHPDSRLFAVGDDWQSIYRFTGSNSMVMKEFLDSERPLTPEDETFDRKDLSMRPRAYRIQETFRTCEPVSNVASKFIQENPNQIGKSVRSARKGDGSAAVGICSVDRYDDENLKRILDLIPESDEKKGVFVLGRKNREIEAVSPENLMSHRNDLRISKRTIHRSKGLEEDFVVVLGMDSGIAGFPNHGGEDPLTSVFLPPGDDYRNSEERRVMYVAMTRAKEKVFLVHRDLEPSSFVGEIKKICAGLGVGFNEVVLREDIVGPCPECFEKGLVRGRSGALVRRVRRNAPPHSVFLGCTNYNRNLCDYTSGEAPCPACLAGGKTAPLAAGFRENRGRPEVWCDACGYRRDYDSFGR